MKIILLLIFSANIFVATSYLVSGNALNGAITCFVGAAQSIINYFFNKDDKKLPMWLILVYIASFVIVNLFPLNLVSMAAALTFVLCITRKSGKTYRICSFTNISLWVTYDLVSKTYAPLVTHLIQLVIVVTGIIIYDVRKQNKVLTK